MTSLCSLDWQRIAEEDAHGCDEQHVVEDPAPTKEDPTELERLAAAEPDGPTAGRLLHRASWLYLEVDDRVGCQRAYDEMWRRLDAAKRKRGAT